MELLSAIRIGVVNSINPCSLIGILVFVVLLYIFSKFRRHLLSVGFSILTGLIFVKTPIDMMLVDNLLAIKEVDMILNFIYIFTAIVFLLITCLFLRDWWVYKVSGREDRLILKFSYMEGFYLINDYPQRKKRWLVLKRIGVYLILFYSGGIIALMLSIWPSDFNMITILYLFVIPGMEKQAIFTYLMFSTANLSPMILLLLLFFAMSRSARIDTVLKQYLPLVQVSLSAIFCGFGLTILFILA